MSRLQGRIAGQPRAAAAAAGSYHPWGTADTPLVMPASMVRYSGGMTGVEQVIFAPDGRMIPMTGAGYGAVHDRRP